MGAGSDVAPDGSPVAVYLALPAEPEFTPVLGAIPAGATVLDLGCGVGRLANLLASRGHRVTGVDESDAMLRHLRPEVERVEARIEGLDLGRRFDAVVLASHFVNVSDAAARRSLLRAAAAHVEASSRVFVEHYDSERELVESDAAVGAVRISFRPFRPRGAEFDGAVTYGLGGRTWEQTFTAVLLDDAALDVELEAAGLRRAQRLSATWLSAQPEA